MLFIIVPIPIDVYDIEEYFEMLENKYYVDVELIHDETAILIRSRIYNLQQVCFHELYTNGEDVRLLHPNIF